MTRTIEVLGKDIINPSLKKIEEIFNNLDEYWLDGGFIDGQFFYSNDSVGNGFIMVFFPEIKKFHISFSSYDKTKGEEEQDWGKVYATDGTENKTIRSVTYGGTKLSVYQYLLVDKESAHKAAVRLLEDGSLTDEIEWRNGLEVEFPPFEP